MAIKEVSPKDENLKDLFQSIGKRKKKAKNRQSFSDESTEDSKDEKKAVTERKKSYKIKLKVASVFVLISLCGLWYAYTSVPSVYDAIMALIRDVFPSTTGSPGIEYYVD